jgi:hypothetical protein
MGECGRGMQIERCGTSVADDMSVARDIARRFEQLETQVNILDSRALET